MQLPLTTSKKLVSLNVKRIYGEYAIIVKMTWHTFALVKSQYNTEKYTQKRALWTGSIPRRPLFIQSISFE